MYSDGKMTQLQMEFNATISTLNELLVSILTIRKYPTEFNSILEAQNEELVNESHFMVQIRFLYRLIKNKQKKKRKNKPDKK